MVQLLLPTQGSLGGKHKDARTNPEVKQNLGVGKGGSEPRAGMNAGLKPLTAGGSLFGL